jgi:AcrR family transcriptional regulator
MPPLKKIIKDAIVLHDEHHRNRDRSRRSHPHCPKEKLRAFIEGKRVRAVDAADKEVRRASILDAAERLFTDSKAFANVSEVARAAGLAKGTVYLYFQTKEEMYLALHMRNAGEFFNELIADLESGSPHGEKKAIDFGYMRALVVKHMLSNPNYFPLVACCVGLPSHSVPAESALATKQLLESWLLRAGAGLERHFPELELGGGVRLLNHSYALMIGLFHLVGEHQHAPQRPHNIGLASFRDEVLMGLSRYWEAVIGRDPSLPAALSSQSISNNI